MPRPADVPRGVDRKIGIVRNIPYAALDHHPAHLLGVVRTQHSGVEAAEVLLLEVRRALILPIQADVLGQGFVQPFLGQGVGVGNAGDFGVPPSWVLLGVFQHAVGMVLAAGRGDLRNR